MIPKKKNSMKNRKINKVDSNFSNSYRMSNMILENRNLIKIKATTF